MAQTVVRLDEQAGISPAESERLGNELGEAFTSLLADLTPEEWAATTRCAPWTVKDISAHLLGWAEALTSVRELSSQVARGVRRSREFGNPTDAQNNIQVEDRAHLSPAEIVDRLRVLLPKESVTRRRFGTALRFVPLYTSYLGGPTTAGYLFNTIFLRDLVIHRLDIYDATGRDPVVTPSDERVMSDMLKDWARRTKANVQVNDDGRLYVAGAGTSTITAPLPGVIYVLAGRANPSDLDIDGDRTGTEDRLRQGVPI